MISLIIYILQVLWKKFAVQGLILKGNAIQYRGQGWRVHTLCSMKLEVMYSTETKGWEYGSQTKSNWKWSALHGLGAGMIEDWRAVQWMGFRAMTCTVQGLTAEIIELGLNKSGSDIQCRQVQWLGKSHK